MAESEKLFDIPKLLYFESKNIYSGSLGKYNYKIFPQGETMKVCVWYGIYCIDCSEVVTTEEFPMAQEGYNRMVEWLDEQHKVFLKSGVV